MESLRQHTRIRPRPSSALCVLLLLCVELGCHPLYYWTTGPLGLGVVDVFWFLHSETPPVVVVVVGVGSAMFRLPTAQKE